MARFIGLMLLVVGTFVCAVGVAAAPTYSDAVYNPVTKSYFQLVTIGQGYSVRGNTPAINWDRARTFARSRVFKGVRGRLAIVKSRAVNDFLRSTFKPAGPAWIGLRYWCKFRVLQWVTGDRLTPKDFQNWDRNWSRAGSSRSDDEPANCQPEAGFYLPVNYWSIQEGFRWNANGHAKELHLLFIEFPTGAE